jgi:hypothetical protein
LSLFVLIAGGGIDEAAMAGHHTKRPKLRPCASGLNE